jgi:alpha-mannosidase
MPIKQQNEECQNLLTRYVEPLAAAALFQYGQRWPGGLFDAAWKELLRNHPHDSICGCSTDAVHQDMDTRFAAVRQTSEQYLSRLMNRLTPMFAAQEKDDRATVIGVANPLPFVRDEVVERVVVLQPAGYDLDNLRLLDEAGHEVPFEIIGRRFLERFWGIDYRAELFCEDQLDLLDTYLRRFGDRIIGTEADAGTKDCFLHIRFLARGLPAVGHVQYRLVENDSHPSSAPVVDPVSAHLADEAATLENQHLRAVLHPDGTFDLEDKATGRRYPGLNLLEDAEDIGDEYDYSPAPINGLFFAGGCEGKLKISGRSDLAATVEATFRFDLPRSVERDRKSRHRRTTPTDVSVRLTLRAGSRRLDIETDFNNRAFDHRLRAWFPTGIKVDEVVSDGHFMLNRRAVSRPTDKDWDQPAPPTWPQQDFSLLHDAQAGLAVFNRGLPEFETFGDQDGGIIYALTLLRCVDWLSRDDFPTRRSTNAGPTLHTPDAQCIGRHTFRYAVMPFAGDPLAADVRGESERFRVPPLTHQGVADGMIAGGTSLVRKTDPRVAITAVKKAERGDLLVVRMYNQADAEVTETLHFEAPVLNAEKINLLEDPLWMDRAEPAVTHGGQRLQVPLAPCEIATVAIAFDSLAPEESL